MEPILVGDLVQQVNDLSEDGFRVLAVATKKLGAQPRSPRPTNAIWF